MISREQLAEENEMSIEFVNWFFDNKKDGCGNAWFMMMAVMWEGWKCNEQKLTDMAVQLANDESKCRELAAVVAENAALKNPDNWLSQSDYGYEASEVATQNGATKDKALRSGILAIINRIEAPATDAFFAEVRAQGVEMFAHDVGESEQGNGLMKAIGLRATKFADQLRKGAAL